MKEEIVKHINETNSSYRNPNAGNAKNTDLFLDQEHYSFFEGHGDLINFRLHKTNLTQAILFIASILPRKFDQGTTHKLVNFSQEFIFDQLSILDALFMEDGKPVDTITQQWIARKDITQRNGKTDSRFYFNGLLSNLKYTDYRGIERETKFIIRNYFAGGYSNIHIIKDNGIFDLIIENTTEPYNDDKEEGLEIEDNTSWSVLQPLQQIFYGAPGTGKSHTIKAQLAKESVIRTTFHPDSDYATFVGSYKPTTKEVVLRDLSGHVVEEGGKPLTESKIIYEFVNQSFLNAYIKAWEFYAEAQDVDNVKKQFLVIEEINRGNCAQIFGDLFQLLDRNDEGFSDYPINADADMQKQLKKALGNLNISVKDQINQLFPDRQDIVSEIINGEVLVLPNNFYIWGTMNTSDQSLFPIDSAFKRRWDWKYMPISDAQLGYVIQVGENKYDWWSFLQAINSLIDETTSSEDKKLGYFFCKEKNGIITCEKFVGKVIFYLWNDVFKDYEFSDKVFYDADNKKLTFNRFYTSDANNKTLASDSTVEIFLKNLGVEKIENEEFEESNEGDDSNGKVHPNLEVILDNITIQGDSSIDIFANAIEHIGIERVASLNIEVSSHKLLSKEKIPFETDGGYGKGMRKLGDYWLITKYDNTAKARFLTKIKEAYNLNMQVSI